MDEHDPRHAPDDPTVVMPPLPRHPADGAPHPAGPVPHSAGPVPHLAGSAPHPAGPVPHPADDVLPQTGPAHATTVAGPGAFWSGSGPADGTYETGPVPFETGPIPYEPGQPYENSEYGTAPGAHRQDDGPARPWAWLIGAVAAALLAVVGLVWMIGSAIGGGGERQPVAAPTRSPTPSLSLSAPTTVPVETATVPAPTPSVTRRVTVPPPAPTTVRPTPRPTRSETPEAVRVPDVVGDRVRSATRALENAGFRVSVLGLGRDRDNRRVAAQSPGGGARARAGSTVVLLVGGR